MLLHGILVLSSCATDKPNLKAQVRSFLVESSKEKDIFPWKKKSDAVDKLAAVGQAVAPHLIQELKNIEEYYRGKSYDFTVQQNITMASCRIYQVQPIYGRTLYSVRSKREANAKVFQFWKQFSPKKSNKKESP